MPFVPLHSLACAILSTQLVQNIEQQTWPKPGVLCVICTSNSWGFVAFCSRLVFTVPLPKRRKEGLVWLVSQLGSSTHGCKSAQVSTGSGLRAAGEWGNGHFRDLGKAQMGEAVAEELCKWGVSWPHTTQTPWNALLKQWTFHGSCMQTHTHKCTSCMSLRILHEGFGCLFLTITTACFHTARGCYPMLDCPLYGLLHQIFPWEIFMQQDTRGVCTFWNRGKAPYEFSGNHIMEHFSGSALPSRSPPSTSSWNLRATSLLWRSVCTDPVRAIPSLYLFKTAVTSHCSFLFICHWV